MNLWDWLRGRDLESPSLQVCGCGHCSETVTHLSSCAVHRGPAFEPGPCDCGAEARDPILPEQEPRKPNSTHERKARGVRTRIQREEIEAALDRMALRAAKAWSESSPDETAKREEAYRLVNVISSLRKELQTVVSDGEMAAAEEQAEARRKAARPADNRD